VPLVAAKLVGGVHILVGIAVVVVWADVVLGLGFFVGGLPLGAAW